MNTKVIYIPFKRTSFPGIPDAAMVNSVVAAAMP
jgi:hypothetical protein